MKDLVLDTSIVLRNPSVFSKRFRAVRIVVPDAVFRQIEFIASKRRDTADLPALIRESQSKGIISVEGAPFEFSGSYKPRSHLDSDVLILRYLEFLKSEGRDFAFVTLDQDLISVCASAGFPTIGQTEFSLLLRERASIDKDLAPRIRSIWLSQISDTLKKVAIGIAIALLPQFFEHYGHGLLAYINIWGTTALLFICGFVLYYVRARWRLVYGIVEFVFAFVSAAGVFWPSFDYKLLHATDYIKVVGGLYIMVRGLDNVQKGLKGTFLEAHVERIFPGS